MATLHPFRALRPNPDHAARIAAVPYDVVSTDEARALAADNPLSFLRVSRAELELPAGTDPYANGVYERAARISTRCAKTRSSSKTSRACTSTAADGQPRADRPGGVLLASTSTTATSSRSTSARGATRKTIARAT
jgi:hypothetical protein